MSETLSELLTPSVSKFNALQPQFVTLASGLRVCYVESGPADAPALILAHGFLGSYADWRYNIVPLAEISANNPAFQGRRVIVLDWAGFGQSDKPDSGYSLTFFAQFLKEFADALGLTKFDLAGHSMGGKHCLAFALFYPEYVRKLILVSSDGFIQDPKWIRYTNTWYFRPLANFSTVLLGRPFVIKATLKRAFYDPKFNPPDEEIERGAARLREPQYVAALRALNRDYSKLSMRLTGLFDRLPELKMPIQIFWGLQDKILHISMAHIAQEILPQASLYVFDECGHLPQVEKSEEFNRLMLEFLEK